MSMADVINSIEHDAFKRCMNQPEEGFDGIADVKVFPDGSCWAVCPWCGKKAVKILPETRIFRMPHKCRNSKCGRNFLVNWY